MQKKKKKSEPLNVLKMADFKRLDSPTLISRKIWVMEKFHSVLLVWIMLDGTAFITKNEYHDENWEVICKIVIAIQKSVTTHRRTYWAQTFSSGAW